MKLESLKDRPATKEDIGKKVYKRNGKPIELLFIEDIDLVNTLSEHSSSAIAGGSEFYWQKPILISEQEYEELQAKIASLEAENNTIREQLEAEIKELKFAYDTSHNADQFLIKTARTKLINQIKEWAVNNKKDSTKIGELILDGIEFVKFLDLLEGE